MNASGVNRDGVAVALIEDTLGSSNRRSWSLKSSRGTDPNRGAGINSVRHSLGGGIRSNSNPKSETMGDDSAISDDLLPAEHLGNSSKTKPRRASEGSYLSRSEGKGSSGELRCDKCGKGYKHSSCLTKHLLVPPNFLSYSFFQFPLLSLVALALFHYSHSRNHSLTSLVDHFHRWEHTPEWSYTSKLLISKHQQVQLLEAASVLVGMNQEASTEQEGSNSDYYSSASPAASGSSDVREEEGGYSSAETTPPPMSEHSALFPGMESGRTKRYSGNSSSFSRSYQSAPSSSFPAGSAFSQYQSQRRPSTSGIAAPADEEEAGLAAAVASLCSFGTPQNRPVLLPADVPPVPPLPAQYAEHNANRFSSQLGATAGQVLPAPFYQGLSDERDVEMDDSHNYRKRNYDYDEPYVPGSRNDEDDEGVFAMDGMTGYGQHFHA
ncbi:hypothetical protein MMC21_002188 [Puttea exsequens]|nr:hypothetical protein [Puttea exsequens]